VRVRTTSKQIRLMLASMADGMPVGCHLAACDSEDNDEVVEQLGSAQRNSASVHQRQYTAMRRPVIHHGRWHCELRLMNKSKRWQPQRLADSA
jgi:hypothetical protein